MRDDLVGDPSGVTSDAGGVQSDRSMKALGSGRRRLIAIAHPRVHDELERAARAMGYLA